jgi:hypothetical protein
MKPKNEFTRSLVIDKSTWEDSMKFSRQRYNMSLSKVIEKLLGDWVEKEKRKPLERPAQKSFH